MAELLYRLGFSSSKKPWAAIVAWIVALALSVGAFLAFSGTLTTSITIPGTPTTEVTDRLQKEFPEAANGSGQVVFRSESGGELTQAQRIEIADLLTEVESLDGVDSVVDPFETDQMIEDQRQELEDGKAQLADGQAQIEDGRAQIAEAEKQLQASEDQLNSGQEQLDAGQAQLDEARAQAEAAGAPAAMLGQLNAQQQQLDAQQAQLDQGRAQLEQGRAQLEEQKAEFEQGVAEAESGTQDLERGESLLTLTEDFRSVSEDGSAAVGTVMFDAPMLDVAEADRTGVVEALEDAEIEGVEVLPTQDLSQTIPSIVGPAEVVGLIVAAIVLLIMLGTFVAAGLPILTALIGVGIGATATLAFSGVVEMLSVTPVLGIMLGLAVGIDYALFIINRHRRQLKDGMPLHESIGLANGTSGNAVVFAGLTVIIALAALNVTGIPFLGLMGTVGAVCVAVAVLIATTLTPALLGLAGHRVLSQKERTALAAAHPQAGLPDDGSLASRSAQASGALTGAGAAATAEEAELVERGLRHQEQAGRESAGSATLATDAGHSAAASVRDESGSKPAARQPMSTARAVLTSVLAIGILVVLAIPFFSMRLGLPDGGSEPVESAAHQAYMTIGEEFGEGRNGPLVVTADLPEGLSEGEVLDQQIAVGEQLAGMDHVVSAVPAAVNEDQTVMMFQVIPEEGPNAVSTEELVKTLRGTEAAGEASNLSVAGMTSGFIDVSDKLSDALPLYLGVVVGLSLIIMVLVFRSILVPVIATGGFILSVFAAMGGVVAIYQWGWLSDVFGVHNPGPILSFLPTIMIGVLFGLAMDYQLFVASGMREAYAHGSRARVAVVEGLHAGRSVVTAAAIIMISVFGGFIFAESAMIRPIGFGLAFGVLVDAFLVRLLLMPALMHLFGDAAWWLPKWLDKIMPNVDVEGSALERSHGFDHEDEGETAAASNPETESAPARATS
ncbi:MMPL family transporter [Micrococcus terreus]|uniref:MMPL family transporter n=1 Tax=Micrococcus terreus TaxID=574650 RepID=UPI00254DC7F6|nr:MMPL family transporter [Micrococcus terreus]MDK7702397.1 MMPL family transporter [Micrococcus terreus]WOO96612.1 MMPL family transporter [Micrococcus terreus]